MICAGHGSGNIYVYIYISHSIPCSFHISPPGHAKPVSYYFSSCDRPPFTDWKQYTLRTPRDFMGGPVYAGFGHKRKHERGTANGARGRNSWTRARGPGLMYFLNQPSMGARTIDKRRQPSVRHKAVHNLPGAPSQRWRIFIPRPHPGVLPSAQQPRIRRYPQRQQ